MVASQVRRGALALLIAAPASHVFANPIAGTDPSQRPIGAPQIVTVDRTGDWYRSALQGVTRPYPLSLRFLEDQGNWHTPFNRPGMPGRYDIRGWHRQ